MEDKKKEFIEVNFVEKQIIEFSNKDVVKMNERLGRHLQEIVKDFQDLSFDTSLEDLEKKKEKLERMIKLTELDMKRLDLYKEVIDKVKKRQKDPHPNVSTGTTK